VLIMIRLREKVRGGYHVHAKAANGDDRTLCGYAYEGNPGDDSEHGVTEIMRGKINCGTCLQIIRFCKKVPARYLKAQTR
jgi:hypothetical protein